MKRPRKNDPRIYEDLVYCLMDPSGIVEVPMTGWNVQRLCAGGYHTALCYAKEDISEIFGKYTDKKLQDVARSCGELDANVLNDRNRCIASILLLLAYDLNEFDKPNMFLASDKFQSVQFERKL